MSEQQAISPDTNRSNRFRFVIAIVLVACMLLALTFRHAIEQFIFHSNSENTETLEQRVLRAEQKIVRLEQDRATLFQQLLASANRTNVMRDEVLGIGQRAALLEENLRALNNDANSQQDRIRMSEIDALLNIAQQRWQLSGDIAGTLQATELAAQSASSLKGSQWLNFRQTLLQELNAYRSIESDPRTIARAELDALEALLPQLIAQNANSRTANNQRTGAARLLNALVQIQPSNQQAIANPEQRLNATTALALEITHARLALQLRNSADFKASALRIDAWLARLYQQNAVLKERRKRLIMAANTPLKIQLPQAGSSLLVLQRMNSRSKP